uniref:Ubiquitin-like protease family profile domain-containing protein n=1 Tax=Brassica oleracea var. oleracea TaxID=109376 RepID=A0A0D3BC00_BRAOL
MKTSTELSPFFTAVTSPKHPLPPAPALSPQGSLSQQYAPIGTLPQFDAIPLNKPSSQSSPSHGLTLPEPDTAPPVYYSSAFLYSPIPLFNPHLLPQPHPPYPLIHYLPHHLDPTNEHGVGEASDSSPNKTVCRVVDELNAQTSVPEVCELSDSSPARKTKEHHPSEAEKVLAQTFLNRPDFPHYLLVTPPPEDLWDIFAKTMATNKKIFHVTPSKLDFSNQFLLQLATPPQWTDSLHMAVLMHMLDMHHKDVLQMENATFMPPTLTSLVQSKDR